MLRAVEAKTLNSYNFLTDNKIMEIQEAILTRRSIRKYTDKKISEDSISTMLQAAMYAPSAMNQQPWHFIVVDDAGILKKLSKIHPYGKMLSDASHGILVCGDEKLQLTEDYWPVDCANATQNLLLSAHGLGLGAVWLGVYPREERMKDMRNVFHLPGHIFPFAMISLGYPAEKKPMPSRFDPQRVHKNKW